MKRFLTFLMVAVLGTSVLMGSAQAKRLGGGGSIGKSSPTYSRQATPPANQAALRSVLHNPQRRHRLARGAAFLAALCLALVSARCCRTSA
jgi:hypothetical protein